MTTRPPVACSAPGKLLVAGEYAVLEPGQPSIAVSVDRFVTVEVAPSPGGQVVFDTDLLPHEVPMLRTATGLQANRAEDTRHHSGALAYLISAVEVVDQLRLHLGQASLPLRLTVRSTLHERGTKIGLGSSGAVTVAAIAALADYHSIPMSPELRFRLALLASIRVDPKPSGADLAASTWGGWVLYRAPDRDRLLCRLSKEGVARTLQAPWPRLSIRPLPPPSTLLLYAGWSGIPSSTSARIGRLSSTAWWHSAAHNRFLKGSARCVTAMAEALEKDTPSKVLAAIRSTRRLLAALDQDTGLGVFTPQLTALYSAAEACGGAGKPSGAGGGDCGIALLPKTADIRALHTQWAAAGVTALPLRVTDPVHTEHRLLRAGPDIAQRGSLPAPSSQTKESSDDRIA